MLYVLIYVGCMLYVVCFMIYEGCMLYDVCSTMLMNVSYWGVIRRFGRQIASFEKGEAMSFYILSIQIKIETFNENHAKIMSKSIKK